MKNRQLAALVLCGGVGVLLSACATKGFVREQVAFVVTGLFREFEDASHPGQAPLPQG